MPLTPPPEAQASQALPVPSPQTQSPGLSYSDLFSNREFINLGGDDPTARHDAWTSVLQSYPEWKKVPKSKQDQMLIDLQRVRMNEEGLLTPPADIAQQTAKSTAARRGQTSTGAQNFLTGEGVKGTPGAVIRQTSGLLRSPYMLVEAVIDNPAKAVGTLGKEFIAQPAREMAGKAQPGEERPSTPYDPDRGIAPQAAESVGARTGYTLASIFGGDAPAAREAFARGATTEGLANLLTVPLLTLGTGKLLKGISKEVAPTRREVGSLQTLSRGAVTGSGPADAASRVAEMQQVVKQVLQKEGITDATLRKEFPTSERAPQSDIVGNVARGNQRILDIARKSVGFVHEPIDAVMTRYGKQPAGPLPSRIANSLRAQATEIGKVNDPLARAISDVADKIEAAKSYSDLNDIKSNANKMLNTVYSPIAGKAIDATAERAFAYKLAADGIRSELYPALQKASGSSLDLSALGRREADAISMRDGIMEHYFKDIAPEQMNKEAAGFWEYTLAGKGAPGHSYFKMHTIGRGLEKSGIIPTAGAEMNKQFQRGAGKIGEGMVPEKLSPLPPPTGSSGATLGAHATPGNFPGSLVRDVSTAAGQKIQADYTVKGNTIEINHMGPAAGGPVTNISPVEFRDLATQLAQQHPGVEVVQGIHAKSGKSMYYKVPVGKLTPYQPGTTARFPNAVRNTAIAARAGRAAQGTRERLTPPPSQQDEEDEQ